MLHACGARFGGIEGAAAHLPGQPRREAFAMAESSLFTTALPVRLRASQPGIRRTAHVVLPYVGRSPSLVRRVPTSIRRPDQRTMAQRYRRGIDKQIEAAEEAEREEHGFSSRAIAEVWREEVSRGRQWRR